MKPVIKKPPKMRFKLGQRVLYEGVEYCIDGAFRLQKDAHEWIYRLVDMTPIAQREALYNFEVMASSLAPEVTRIVYEPFRESYDAVKHFAPIPAPPGRRGDECFVANKRLLQQCKGLS